MVILEIRFIYTEMAKVTPPQINATRFRTSLKMAISKLKFIQDKKLALAKQQRRQLADLLNQGKELSAKIRVENVIRDDIYVELLEYLELYCELLLARIGMITDPNKVTCDANIIDAVQSIIYSAQYTELKEMVQLKELFIYKYGIEFGKVSVDNSDNHVPEKIVKRCEIEVPSENLVNLYLCEISKAYEAPYSGLAAFEEEQRQQQQNSNIINDNNYEHDDDDDDDDDDNDNGGSGGEKERNKETIKEAIKEAPISDPVTTQDK
jgi:vacuolar protein sorting-associated protein IST1